MPRTTLRLVAGLAVGLAVGLLTGPILGLQATTAWVTSVSAAQMALRWRVPAHLMSFLDDAHRRNVLRTIGPAYQFRHARLQDRLADSPEMPRQAR